MRLLTGLKQTKKLSRAANPARILALSFFMVIMVGTLLLMLPVSSRSGQWTSPLTALFTATSATCVTGLSTVDTGLYWAPFGQVVLLCMIQLGGLGFMTLLYTFAILLRRRLTISRQLVLMGALNLNSVEDALRIAKHTLAVTLSCEGAGAALLAVRFIPEQKSVIKGLWYSVFHSVSAFCNAGFDLVGGLARYQRDIWVNGVIIFLIVASGLGFFVWEELIIWWKTRKPLSLASQLVLHMIAFLLLSGTVLFLILEYNNPSTLGNLSLPHKLLAAAFQSVTLRTAGFATVDQGGLTEGSKALSILYMFVGGNSGSTAGGIKVSTIIVLIYALKSGLRGEERVKVRGRTLRSRQVFNAMTLTLLVGLAAFVGALLLSVLEKLPFLECMYETASAIATVGLSTGITSSLSAQSQLILICMMYLGRVGILSFSFSVITHRPVVEKISYPSMDMMIG